MGEIKEVIDPKGAAGVQFCSRFSHGHSWHPEETSSGHQSVINGCSDFAFSVFSVFILCIQDQNFHKFYFYCGKLCRSDVNKYRFR